MLILVSAQVKEPQMKRQHAEQFTLHITHIHMIKHTCAHTYLTAHHLQPEYQQLIRGAAATVLHLQTQACSCSVCKMLYKPLYTHMKRCMCNTGRAVAGRRDQYTIATKFGLCLTEAGGMEVRGSPAYVR